MRLPVEGYAPSPSGSEHALDWRRVGSISGAPTRLLPIVLVVAGLLLALPSLIPAGKSEEDPATVAGTTDFSFRATGVKSPTGRKPEASKLWFNDGAWWAVLFRPNRDGYVINRLDAIRDEWVDTGTMVDDRNGSRADVLWTGTHLYTVSGGADATSEEDAAVLVRMSYDSASGSYAMDRGFPVRITGTGAETFTVDQDETGRLWVTWTAGRAVWMTHSLANDQQWTEPWQLPLPEAQDLSPDDISSVIAYDGHVGVMWSDQLDGAMYWASAPAGATSGSVWSVTAAVQGPGLADDHMNLKSLHDDPAGVVVAAIKTSRNDVPNPDPADPLILILVLQADGSWSRHVVSTVRENETRPLLVVDAEHRRLHVVTSAPCCSGGTIYHKVTSLDEIQFLSGRGTTFMKRTGGALNNPSASKHDVTAETGLLVIASDDNADVYMHRHEELTGEPVSRPSPSTRGPAASGDPASPTGPPEAVLFEDGFEDRTLDAWSDVGTGEGSRASVEARAARTDRYGLRLVSGTSPDGFAFARVALAEGERTISVHADVRFNAEGPADANAPLLRLLAADGSRIFTVYRQNRAGGRIWMATPDAREATLGRAALDTWVGLEVRMSAAGDAREADVRMDGRLIGRVLLPAGSPDVRFVQIGNEATGQFIDVDVDTVRVRR